MKKGNAKNSAIRAVKSLDELLDVEYGKVGTPERSTFEEESLQFVISEMIRHARKEAHLTQQALAEKIGTKKSYISKIESGRSDINITTLVRIVEDGLGRKLQLNIL